MRQLIVHCNLLLVVFQKGDTRKYRTIRSTEINIGLSKLAGCDVCLLMFHLAQTETCLVNLRRNHYCRHRASFLTWREFLVNKLESFSYDFPHDYRCFELQVVWLQWGKHWTRRHPMIGFVGFLQLVFEAELHLLVVDWKDRKAWQQRADDGSPVGNLIVVCS